MKSLAFRSVAGIALLALLLGASEDQTKLAPAGEPVLLWEPTWSPLALRACMVAFWDDILLEIATWDMEGDGKPELLVKGAMLHSLVGCDFSPLPDEPSSSGVELHNDPRAPGGVREVRTTVPGEPHDTLVCLADAPIPDRETLWDATGFWSQAPVDLDGDLRSDLIILGDAGVWPTYNSGAASPWHGFWAVEPAEGAPFASRPEHASDIWVGDVTWDGVADVLVDGGYGKFYVAAGLGEGQFGPLEKLAVEGSVFDVAWGKEGVWIATDTGLWLIRHGEAAPALETTDKAYALAVADMTGDGIDEVAIGNHSGVRVLTRQASGRLEVILQFADCGTVAWIDSGELNADGYADIAFAAWSASGVWTLFGAPVVGPERVRWQGIASEYSAPALPREGLLCDLNADGRDELAAILGTLDSTLLVMSPSPCGRSVQELPGVILLCAGDADGDGAEDLLADSLEAGVMLLRNLGGGWFEASELVELGQANLDTAVIAAAWVDVDADSVSELATWHVLGAGGTLVLWERAGDAWMEAWRYELTGEPHPALRTGDVDADGILEVVIAAGDRVAMLGGCDGLQGVPPKAAVVSLPGAVSLFEVLQRPEGCDVVALAVDGDDDRWVRVTREGATDLPLAVETTPLGSTAADVDGDGSEELLVVGLGTIPVEETTQLVAFTTVARVGADSAEIVRETPIDGWTWGAVPFPQFGVTHGDFNGDGREDMAVLELPTEEYSRGRVAMLDGESGETYRWCDRTRGYGLVALDADSDGIDDVAWVAAGAPSGLGLTLGARPAPCVESTREDEVEEAEDTPTMPRTLPYEPPRP